MSLSLAEIQLVNTQRATRWHGDMESWSGLEWAGAMCGEAGEAANIAKKLKRAEQGLSNHSADREYASRDEMVEALGQEIADTILYALLLGSRYHINVNAVLVKKFNRTSELQGFPERL